MTSQIRSQQESLSSILEVLRRTFNDFGEISGDNEIAFFCPKHVHHKRKLNINLNNFTFHCWVCDASGRGLSKLVETYNLNRDDFKKFFKYKRGWQYVAPKEEKDTPKKLELPYSYEPLYYHTKSIHYNRAMKYLEDRNINLDQILLYKIGFCDSGEYFGRIIVPSFDSSGELNYYVGRSFLNHPNKYKNPSHPKESIIFNELLVDFTKPVVLCEGVFDAFVCGQNSIPLLGSSISDKLINKLVTSETKNIILVLDPDAYLAEKKDSKLIKISRKLAEYAFNVSFVDIRPYKDVGEMTNNEFRKRLESSKLIDYSFILNAKLGDIL